jgi:putative intracellular protease/amidase
VPLILSSQKSGPGARPHNVHPSLNIFIQKQAPGAKYILTVCTGSWILANTGLLDGKNATTNKASFNTIKVRSPILTKPLNPIFCQANTSSEINWVPQARWVVDGNIWTSSGVSAGENIRSDHLKPAGSWGCYLGIDMASRFVEHLVGEDIARFIRGRVEVSVHSADDDEFAAFNELL